MKFIHTGDWHIGKKINGYDLLEEQEAAFRQMMMLAEKEKVDAIVIAGDLYDRSVPSTDAVELFNKMLVEMNLEKKFPILAISGNHDSATRLETGSPWFEPLQFHLHTNVAQAFEPAEIKGVQFFLLPYFEPFAARHYFGNEELRTLQECIDAVIKKMHEQFDSEKKQVLVSHFFVAGSQTTDSETKVTVGGLDVVPVDLLKEFDYVALGHLHSYRALNSEFARYSGSLLKYSLSEVNQEKGVWLVDVTENGVEKFFHPIEPLRDVKIIEESFATLMDPVFYETINREDYIGIRLTDREVIPNVMNQLRSIYPRIIQLERAYGREEQMIKKIEPQDIKASNPQQLFTNFFEETIGEKMTSQQQKWLEEELQMIVYEK